MADPVTQQERLIARRAKPMQLAIQRWMLKRAREEATKAIRNLRPGGQGWTVAKMLGEPLLDASRRISDETLRLHCLEDDPERDATPQEIAKARSDVEKARKQYEVILKKEPIDKELLEILMRFGVAQANTASMRIGSLSNLELLIDPRRLQRELSSKEFKLKIFTELEKWATKRVRLISADTRRMVKDSIMRVLTEASAERPQPSAGEMARRIRTQFHGEDAKGRLYAWSPERAALIARTELVQAENTGAAKSYEAAGVKRIRWLAKTGDRRSGERQHWKMHGKEIKFGETFTTPLGNKLRYPGDPAGDVADLIQCRCTYRAVITRGNTKQEVGT